MKLKSAVNIREISDSYIGYRLFNCMSRHARGVLSEFGAFLIIIILLSSCHDKQASEIIENPIGSVVSFPTSLKPVHKDTYHRTPSEIMGHVVWNVQNVEQDTTVGKLGMDMPLLILEYAQNVEVAFSDC